MAALPVLRRKCRFLDEPRERGQPGGGRVRHRHRVRPEHGGRVRPGVHRLEGQVAVEHVVAEGDRDFGVPMANLPTEVDVVFYGGSLEGAGLVRALREAGGDLLARRPGLPVRGGSRLQPSRAAIPLTEDAEFGRSEQP